MNNQYYILENEEQAGPFTYNELIERGIDIHTEVLNAKNEWEYVSELPEFFDYFQAQGIYLPTEDNIDNIGWRVLAFVIDYLIVVLVTVSISLNYNWITLPAPGATTMPMPQTPFIFYIEATLCITYLLYHTLLEQTSWKGSIGKKICGLRVVDANGQKLSLLKSAGRNLGAIVSINLYGIPFLGVFISEHKQPFYDKLTGAYMIKV
jgi:uncharacterized RDD family membrane protein YckC